METIFTRKCPKFKYIQDLPIALILPDTWRRLDEDYLKSVLYNKEQSLTDGTLEIIQQDNYTLVCINR